MGRLSYLLDSNIISEPSRPKPSDKLQYRLQANYANACTAAPVLHELRYGLKRMPEGRRKRELSDYLERALQPLIVLPYDRDAALWHAEERVRLAALGRTPPLADSLIAAIARVNGLILVTRNTGDFVDFTGLHIENWFV